MCVRWSIWVAFAVWFVAVCRHWPRRDYLQQQLRVGVGVGDGATEASRGVGLDGRARGPSTGGRGPRGATVPARRRVRCVILSGGTGGARGAAAGAWIRRPAGPRDSGSGLAPSQAGAANAASGGGTSRLLSRALFGRSGEAVT